MPRRQVVLQISQWPDKVTGRVPYDVMAPSLQTSLTRSLRKGTKGTRDTLESVSPVAHGTWRGLEGTRRQLGPVCTMFGSGSPFSKREKTQSVSIVGGLVI